MVKRGGNCKLDLLVTSSTFHFSLYSQQTFVEGKTPHRETIFLSMLPPFFFFPVRIRQTKAMSLVGVRELQLLHPPIPTCLSTKKTTIFFSIRKDLICFTLWTDFRFETPFPFLFWGGVDVIFLQCGCFHTPGHDINPVSFNLGTAKRVAQEDSAMRPAQA